MDTPYSFVFSTRVKMLQDDSSKLFGFKAEKVLWVRNPGVENLILHVYTHPPTYKLAFLLTLGPLKLEK